jgi:hypothetical protein
VRSTIQKAKDFIGPTRVVGRIPDITGGIDQNYFAELVRIAAEYKPASLPYSKTCSPFRNEASAETRKPQGAVGTCGNLAGVRKRAAFAWVEGESSSNSRRAHQSLPRSRTKLSGSSVNRRLLGVQFDDYRIEEPDLAVLERSAAPITEEAPSLGARLSHPRAGAPAPISAHDSSPDWTNDGVTAIREAKLQPQQ